MGPGKGSGAGRALPQRRPGSDPEETCGGSAAFFRPIHFVIQITLEIADDQGDDRTMRVVLADSMGMCFGVRDAVKMALHSPHRSELTILGELVHNTEVLRRLREAGVRSVASVDAPVETPRVMITAHG